MLLFSILACTEPVQVTIHKTAPPAYGVSGLLPLTFSHSGGLKSVTLTIDGRSFLVDDGIFTLDPSLSEGETTAVVTATPSSWAASQAQVELSMVLDFTPPTLQIQAPNTKQGHTAAVHIISDEPLRELSVQLGDQIATAVATPYGYRALLGVPINATVQKAPLLVTAVDVAGNSVAIDHFILINDAHFLVGGHIALTEEQTRQRQPSPALTAMKEERAEANSTKSLVQRWSGPFVSPAIGRRTSPFAKYRTYSDKKSSFHEGIDIAAKRTTPIVAPAPGVVVLAKPMPIYGNVIFVDHGLGVVTNYNHLKELKVHKGQEVKQGQLLGEMGTTGQSTGSHLHFEVHVNQVAVSPDQWLSQAF